MPLPFAPILTALRIVKVRTDAKVAKHLASLGIVEGGEVEVLESKGGSTIVRVKGGRLALDANVSRGILVAA